MPDSFPTPAPPVAEGTGLPWDVPVDDAVGAIAAARARHGDTFVVNSGADHYLFTFSPTGVESFYALPEEQASKGVADYLMLRRKLPDEIFVGRRVLPNSLFRRDDVASYLANLHWALNQAVAELGSAGSVDLFDLTRRLGHRMGLASWAGPGSAEGDSFERLVSAFDTLDGSDAFVHPDAMAAVAASDKRAERSALEVVAAVVETAVHRLDSGEMADTALFGRIVEAWSAESAADRMRGIGMDVALIHIASMSNLMAALGWAMVDLLEHPTELDAVVGGDGELAQRCALESTRLAQRSIMSRAVLAPVDLDTGDATYRVPAGWTIATLLPLLNTSVGARPGTLESRPLAPAPARGPECAAVADVGDGLRARTAFLSGPAVLAGCDDVGDDSPAGPLPDDAALGLLPSTGSAADRRGGAGGRALSGRLRRAVTATRR